MKIKYLVVGILMLVAMCIKPVGNAVAEDCPELKIVFARGSGGERWVDQNYMAFRDSLTALLGDTEISYEFLDLDYPAVGIGDVTTLLGAFFGGGEAYKFGKSVGQGVEKLVAEVNNKCPATKYVVAGYSQGAMVVSKSLRRLDAEKIVYAATFGDPKIYLPEGAGMMPVACMGAGLSDYRMYVPDCRAYLGKLGTYLPYQPESFDGKFGVWCNSTDIFCSSYLSVKSHTSYVSDRLYEDAAKVIYAKIVAEFGLPKYVSPHDTAIMIDSTKSMEVAIKKFRAEALRLARETLANGGRVALYDYRDFKEGYAPVMRCDFGCTLDEFEVALNAIKTNGGGDWAESFLGSSFAVMKELKWQFGATKSLVVLTDAGYFEPDADFRQTTFYDVVKLSQEIDPVNIYVVTGSSAMDSYRDITEATGGKVINIEDPTELPALTDTIMTRNDALPRVVLSDDGEMPTITIEDIIYGDDSVEVRFNASDKKVMVALNDAFLGVVEGDAFTLGELDFGVENILTLVPINETRSGMPVSVTLSMVPVPLAPDTGRL